MLKKMKLIFGILILVMTVLCTAAGCSTDVPGQPEEDTGVVSEEKEAEEDEPAPCYSINNYFAVEMPGSWKGKWSKEYVDNSTDEIRNIVYTFSQSAVGNGGTATVYILNLKDSDGNYDEMVPENCKFIGETSYEDRIYVVEEGDGFFAAGAEITLK